MKFLKYILVFFILAFISCKSSKNLTNRSVNGKTITAKNVIKEHLANNFTQKTVDAKLKVNFKNEKQKIDFSVRMKIKKDEVIWLKGTKLITVFKAKITPDKISFYSPYFKNYIEGDFNMLENILGASINFHQLQNILLGQVIFDNSQKHNIELINNSYKLTPKKQPDLFDIFYWINPTHYKLDKQSLVNEFKGQELNITYPLYKKTNKTMFPERILIDGKSKNQKSEIDLLVKSVIFNEEISIPFSIPEGYKEIKL